MVDRIEAEMATRSRFRFLLAGTAVLGGFIALALTEPVSLARKLEHPSLHPIVGTVNDWLSVAGMEIDPATIRGMAGDLEDVTRGWLQFAGAALAATPEQPDEPNYRFDLIRHGDLLSTVAATGALNPVATVQVGSQLSGPVKEIYADFNDEVRHGDPLLLVDPIDFEITVEQFEADLQLGQTAFATQEAMIERMTAALENAQFDHQAALANAEGAKIKVDDAAGDFRRKKALGQGIVSDADRERAESAHLGAVAQFRAHEAIQGAKASLIRLAEAELRAAHWQLANLQAAVRQKEAALRQARLELERTVLRSPIDGIVIQRNIEVGQAVSGNMYVLAQDLREMQVNASVDESEIGRIAPGQKVEFSVDAFPGQQFAGTVDQIRKTPQTVQNVVTYTVIVKAHNPDMLLLPGMTASARFIIAASSNVAKVPNAALRFRPPNRMAPVGTHVWTESEGMLEPIEVQVGLTDGTHSEISGDSIEVGVRVVTGMERPRQEPSFGKRLIGIY